MSPSVGITSSVRAALLLFLAAAVTLPRLSVHPHAASAHRQLKDAAAQLYYANAHPYLEDSTESLLNQIPELRGLQPAPDQYALPMILKRTGQTVEAFFDDIVDVIAHEEIQRQKVNARGKTEVKELLQDNYLILLHRDELPPRLEEYRTDANGNRLDRAGSNTGLSVTSGFALKCIHFLPAYLLDSTFRYLGDQTLESRNTYVVAFAQRPTKATIMDTISVDWGTVPILMQGIAWIDQANFRIIRLRTDLLAPRLEIGLSRQTTDVTFTEVRLPDVAAPLWLPSKVTIVSLFGGNSFRNEHHYTAYQRFRVAVRMVPQ